MGSESLQIVGVGFSIVAFATFSYAGMSREDSAALSRAFVHQDQTWRWYVVLGAAFIQLRLLCNLVSGKIGVGEEKKSIAGDLYKDVLGRIADVFVILGCALVANGPYRLDLGWFCAITVVGAAYIQAISAVVAAEQRPFGCFWMKYRMTILSGGCVLLAIYPEIVRGHNLMDAILFIVSAGTIHASWRGLRAIKQNVREADEIQT